MQPNKKRYIKPTLQSDYIYFENSITASSVKVEGYEDNQKIEVEIYLDIDFEREINGI